MGNNTSVEERVGGGILLAIGAGVLTVASAGTLGPVAVAVATSIESPENLLSGTVTGTSIDIFERTGGGRLNKHPVVSLRIYWGSSSVRIIISKDKRSQDFILLESGEVIEVSKADELKKKLEGLKISRLKEIHIQKIIDILPTREEDVKVVLQGYNITLTKENYKKIADTVKAFV